MTKKASKLSNTSLDKLDEHRYSKIRFKQKTAVKKPHVIRKIFHTYIFRSLRKMY